MLTKNKPFAHAFAIVGLVALSACGSGAETDAADASTQIDETETLAAALGKLPELSTVNSAIVTADLNTVFDGVGSYTLLAPSDEAFAALGEAGQALMNEEQKPILVGVLRNHILPGYLQPEDIAKAIDAKDGAVTMTTLGGGDVTFTKDGETITVTREDGASAQFSGKAVAASNGVVIPIGAVLQPQ